MGKGLGLERRVFGNEVGKTPEGTKSITVLLIWESSALGCPYASLRLSRVYRLLYLVLQKTITCKQCGLAECSLGRAGRTESSLVTRGWVACEIFLF